MKHKFRIFFLAIVMCLGTLTVKDYIDSIPIIVFIGGGSAKNYIDSLEGPKIEEYPGSFYINVPSRNAWLALVEEIERYDHRSDKKKKPTAIICLSAGAIDSGFINKENNWPFFENKRIVGIELGADELIVYRYQINSIKELGLTAPNSISIKELERIIKNDSIKKYTTKEGSGTLIAYDSLINDNAAKDILKDNNKRNVFYDFSTNLESGFILGSYCYKPKVNSLQPMYIKDAKKKPICIYFATYQDDASKLYMIDEPIRKFISSFKAKINKDVWDKIKSNGNWKDAAEHLEHNKKGRILYLNDTLQYIKPYKVDTISGKQVLFTNKKQLKWNK